MMGESEVKLTIAFNDSDLDEEQLDKTAQNLLQELRQLDEVERVDLVRDPNPLEKSKALGGFLVGMLTAEVNPANTKALLGFLRDRLGGKPIEMEVEANGKKLKVKAHSQQEFLVAIQAAQQFIESAQEGANG